MSDAPARPTRDLDGDAELSALLQASTRAGLFYQSHVTGEHVWSPALLELLGLAPDFVVSVESFLALMHKDDMLRAIETATSAQVAAPGYQVEFRLRRSDGVWLHMRAQSRFERDEHGAIVAEHGVLRDISEQVELEQRAITAQRRSAIGRIAAGIAHDFNNMLSAVLGEAELQLLEQPPEPIAAALRSIVDATERAATLSRRLLTFTRQQVDAPRIINLDDALLNLQRLLRRVISERCELRFRLSGTPLLLHVDPVHIEQVVMNLVVNARDAISSGGVIEIRTAEVVGPNQRMAELIVEDDGSGMSPEVLARAQDEFFTTKSHGTGLGLATSRQIVVDLGGSLEITSELGHGTRIRILLPLVPEYAVVVDDGELTLPITTEVSVLVVEDEPLLADLTVRTLRGFGYLAHAETERQAALQWLAERSEGVDVLVADGAMPGITLAEFLAAFRQRCPAGVIVVVSGYLPDEQLGSELPDGVGFLAKPFTPAGLSRTIQAALARARR